MIMEAMANKLLAPIKERTSPILGGVFIVPNNHLVN